MKGHIVVCLPVFNRPVKFGKVLRAYYTKNCVMYDIKWDDDSSPTPYRQNQIDWAITHKDWVIFNSEKELLKFKLKGF